MARRRHSHTVYTNIMAWSEDYISLQCAFLCRLVGWWDSCTQRHDISLCLHVASLCSKTCSSSLIPLHIAYPIAAQKWIRWENDSDCCAACNLRTVHCWILSQKNNILRGRARTKWAAGPSANGRLRLRTCGPNSKHSYFMQALWSERNCEFSPADRRKH